MTYFCGHNN